MKYARATWRIFLSWAARKLRLPQRLVWALEDRDSLARFECSLEFEPAEVVDDAEYYQVHRDDEDEWGEHISIPSQGKRLGSIISPRFTPAEADQLREYAKSLGITASEAIRRAVAQSMHSVPAAPAPTDPIGWHCEHATITAGGVTLNAPTFGCGCQMQPLYATGVAA